MKISELIEALARIRYEAGDLQVGIEIDAGGGAVVNEVNLVINPRPPYLVGDWPQNEKNSEDPRLGTKFVCLVNTGH